MSDSLLVELLTPVEPETSVDSDGWIYRVDTGEVVGRLDDQQQPIAERFEVKDEASADWVLQIRSETESEIVKLDAQFAAFKKQYDARRNAQIRRLSYLEYRFSPSLIAFAKSQLVGKARTWRGTFGSVAFRKTPGSTKILDDAAAVEFVKTWEPARVKVIESVTVKSVMMARDQAAIVSGEEIDLPFLATSGPGESVEISTGIEIKGGER